MTADVPARARRRIGASPWLLLLPSVAFMLLVFGWPLLTGALTSFQGTRGVTLEHWSRLFADPYFFDALRNTLLLVAIVVPVQFALSVGMALLLQSRPRFAGFHFYVWTVPLAVSDLAAGLVWLTMFSDRGYLNSLLHVLGLSERGVQWLNYDSPTTMFLAVLIAEIWRATSLVFVIVIAGLQMVPKDYDEAAQVFGAGAWQRLRTVTLPLLRPSLQVALILRTILALQAFAVAQALTGRSFPLLVGETYEWYVNLQNPPVASALALVVLLLSMIASVVYLRALRPAHRGGPR